MYVTKNSGEKFNLMDAHKESIIISGLELQGQVHLLSQLLASKMNNENLDIEDLYKKQKNKLDVIKRILRKDAPNKYSLGPVSITEFEKQEIASPESADDGSKVYNDFKRINTKIKDSYDALLNNIRELEMQGVNCDNLYFCLSMFASQMIIAVKDTEKIIDRREQVDDVIRRNKKSDDRKNDE